MKTRLDFIVPLSLLVAAAVGFAVVQGRREEPPASTEAKPVVRRLRMPGSATSPRQLSDAAVERSRKLIAELDAGQLASNQKLKDIYAKYDPDQMIQRGLTGFMEKREPKYRQLLSGWDLDTPRTDQVLELLRNWEFHAFKDGFSSMKKLPTDATTFNQEQMSQWAQKYASKRGGLELSIEAELLPFLGTERSQQIMQLREQMRKEEQAKIIGAIEREKND